MGQVLLVPHISMGPLLLALWGFLLALLPAPTLPVHELPQGIALPPIIHGL